MYKGTNHGRLRNSKLARPNKPTTKASAMLNKKILNPTTFRKLAIVKWTYTRSPNQRLGLPKQNVVRVSHASRTE